ncbi:hypothetical protein DL764_000177 [Monosporascus ibericus]|uniref:Insecticide toxin TcdB middle/N-terminal domain-containing protein n=1 Tax=Monosporascus ibericus TaxID=155417 RepID=A0A4Q4TUQ9_9PEZI|nr:hypothetical protein DL764_000177 [Monosporascus ibericus]
MGSGCMVFAENGMGDIRGVRFVDINGDHRDDWVWISTNVRTTTWVNQSGEGKGIVPRWFAGSISASGTPEASTCTTVQAATTSNSVADLAVVVTIMQELNGRTAVTKMEQAASNGQSSDDGARWAACEGEGLNNYIWIPRMGDITRGIPGGSVRALETGMDCRASHIGDWDGEGRDGVIPINNVTGPFTVRKSNWGLGYQIWIHPFDHHQQWQVQARLGVGYFHNAVHFAGITNVLGRANYQFADVKGDGRAELSWSVKSTGDAGVWQNVEKLPENKRKVGSKLH